MNYSGKGVSNIAQEKQFENRVKRYLMEQGIYNLGTSTSKMKIPPVGYYTKRWGGSIFTASGLPDMQIVIKGKCLELELKAPNGKPSELQIQKINQINESGGTGLILYPKDFDTFKILVERMIAGGKG